MRELEQLDKNNLHHAYLIEGIYETVMPKLLVFIKDLGVEISGNPDFCQIVLDSLKMEDARDLKSKSYEKSFSLGKKIFVIYANNFLLEAQNALLKVFEEPIANTHFFVILPNTNLLLATLASRFYVIKTDQTESDMQKDSSEAERFLKMPEKNRIDFIKEMLSEKEEETEEENSLSNNRSRAIKFINTLEFILHKNLPRSVSKGVFDTKAREVNFFVHLFKVREFLNQPGSSVKSLME